MDFFKRNWAFFVILFSFPFLQIYIDTKNSFLSDSLGKTLQAESLLNSNFTDEELVYPASEFDPERQLSVVDEFARFVKGRYIGQYPIAFSIILAGFRFLGVPWEIMPAVSFIFLPITFGLLGYYGFLRQRTFFVLLLGTVLFSSLIDVNETPVFFLINTLGFIFWIRYRKSLHLMNIMLSLALFSFGAYFRLESILFIVALVLGEIFEKKKDFFTGLTPGFVLSFFIGFIPLYFFFVWNFYDYGHALGPRYFFNFYPGPVSLSEKLTRASSIVFTYYNGAPKLGFFLCSPFLFLPVLYSVVVNRSFAKEKDHLFYLVVSFVFLLLVSFTAPNDGVTISGRYLLLLILPLIFLYENWMDLPLSRSWRIANVATIVFAFLIVLVQIAIFRMAAKHMKEVKDFISSRQTPVLLFTNKVHCAEGQLEHLKRPIFCLNTVRDWEKAIHPILEDPNLKEFTLFSENEKLRKMFLNQDKQWSDEGLSKLKAIIEKDYVFSEKEESPLGIIANLYKRK